LDQSSSTLLKEGNLSAEDIPTTGYKPATTDFIDGVEIRWKMPLEYIKSLKIGNKS
jgi:nitrate/nitrite transport system substrate-binding protein